MPSLVCECDVVRVLYSCLKGRYKAVKEGEMMKCGILALQQCPLSSVTGPMEILSLANSLAPKQKRFNIRILSEEKSEVSALGGLNLQTHGSLDNEQDYRQALDLVIVGAIGHPAQRAEPVDRATLNWLKHQHQQGAMVVSICTGAFVLAEAGLLDNKQATTHWACQELFKQRFPAVKLDANAMITQDGQIACSGGASAFQDMSIYIIRQFLGAPIARHCAKSVLIDLDRHSQLQYRQAQYRQLQESSTVDQLGHNDQLILKVQDWLESHVHESFTLVDLAEQINLSL